MLAGDHPARHAPMNHLSFCADYMYLVWLFCMVQIRYDDGVWPWVVVLEQYTLNPKNLSYIQIG